MLGTRELLNRHSSERGRGERGSALSAGPTPGKGGFEDQGHGREAAWKLYHGRVVDSAGSPVSEALIDLDGSLTTADASGFFRCLRSAAAVEVRVSKEGYEPLTVPVNAGTLDLGVLTLIREGSENAHLQGRVVDSNGDPLPGLEVHYGLRTSAEMVPIESCLSRVFLGGSVSEHEHGSVRSSADGSFTLRLEDLEGGLVIWAQSLDAQQAGELLLPEPAESAFLLLRLEPVRTLEGRVVDHSGAGVPQVPVCAAPFGQDLTRAPLYSSRWSRTSTAAGGEFVLEGVSPGPLSIGIGVGALQIFRVANVGDDDLELVIAESRSVEGRAIDATTQRPVEGVQLNAIVTSFNGDQVSSCKAKSDPEGRFVLSGVPREGLVHLIARHPSYALADTRLPGSSLWTASPATTDIFSEPLEVELDAGVVLGVELEGADGAPVSGTLIKVTGHGGLIQTAAHTDESGTARLEHLSPGKYLAELPRSEGSLDPGTAWIDVIEDGKSHKLRMAHTVAIKGRLVDSQADPCAGGALTIVVNLPGSLVPSAEIKGHSDAAGAFEIAKLPVGAAFTLTAAHPDHLQATVYGELQPGSMMDLGDVVLVGHASVEGFVLTTSGSPLEGAELHVVRPTGLGAPMADAISGKDGRFRITGVEVGTALVVARKEGYYPKRVKRLELAPGQVTSGIFLTLAEGDTHAGRVTDRRGDPFPGATVTATWAPTFEEEQGEGLSPTQLRRLLAFSRLSTLSAHDGSFSIRGIPPDQPIEFAAFADGFKADPASFNPYFVGVEENVQIVMGRMVP